MYTGWLVTKHNLQKGHLCRPDFHVFQTGQVQSNWYFYFPPVVPPSFPLQAEKKAIINWYLNARSTKYTPDQSCIKKGTFWHFFSLAPTKQCMSTYRQNKMHILFILCFGLQGAVAADNME